VITVLDLRSRGSTFPLSGHPGQLSLEIPFRVGSVNAGDGYSHWSYHSVRNVVDRGVLVLHAMWEELAGKVKTQ